MAWLITLALFWAIGSWIAKGIDSSNSKSFKQAEYRHIEHEKFLDNLYVADINNVTQRIETAYLRYNYQMYKKAFNLK